MSTEHGTQPRVDCAVEADGRIVFELRQGSAREETLLLRLRPKKAPAGKEQAGETLHVLDLEPAGDGRRRAVLGPRPVLAEGRWDVYAQEGPQALRRRLRPGLRDLRALVDGHRRDGQSPLAVRIPYVTKDGHLAVRAWVRRGHAEAGRIDVTARSVTVEARLHGATLAEGAVVRLRPRGGGTERSVAPRIAGDGRSLTFTVDHAELTAGAGDAVWNVFVQPAEAAPLIRVARLLDDVADRKEVFVYPTVTLDGAGLRPYYTVDNDLSLKVTGTG